MTEEKINNCSWGFKCKQTWQGLRTTLNPDIRFCADCRKDVFKTSSKQEVTENLELGRCMYFAEEFKLSEQEDDSNIIIQHSVGFMVPPPEYIYDYDPDDDKSKE